MADVDWYRPNVGIILINRQCRVFWARRVGSSSAWQFPQGGIKERETPDQALFRELHEEIGLAPEHVKILDITRGWLKYKLPSNLIRRHQKPVCIGQKQKWYLLKLLADESAIRLDSSHTVEFDDWRWVNYWYPLDQIVSFKREVYRRVLKALSATHHKLECAYDLNRDS